MNAEQKEYLRREIRRTVRLCRRSLRRSAAQFEAEQVRLETLWEVQQEMRKMEVES